LNDELFPFESRFLDVRGANVHYIDEGDGPVFLALHGNPTWSFLYRHIVRGLADRFRCVALDYPGFGLSTAPAGYRYTIAEHARVVDGFVEQLALREVTLMVQDWGGPIGFWVATRRLRHQSPCSCSPRKRSALPSQTAPATRLSTAT
jgi:haloalkane dehalogenase